MYISENFSNDEEGNLTISGVNTLDIAKKFKTPLYVMDVNLIRKNCRKFKGALEKYCETNSFVCYASKAFSCKKIYEIMKEEKMCVDVVSLGELFTAISAGFPKENIYFHGNNKTEEELEFAVKNEIGKIVVDNLSELKKLNEIAEKNNVVMKILLRIKPGVDAHVHEYVTTGKIDSKFGFTIEENEALGAVKLAKELKNVKLEGLHCHIGSQILEIKPFLLAAEVMMKFIKKIKDECEIEINELNLGGGFGVKYLKTDSFLDVDECLKNVISLIKQKSNEFNLKMPSIAIEPGRAIVAQAGITLYTIGSIKQILKEKTYISVDGGMTDNPRYILYKSLYEATIANKAAEKKVKKYSIAGKCCESGDLIGENVLLQEAEEKDILAVFATGAYNYSMFSNYNRNLCPAVVFVEDGKCSVAVKRQTLEDLIRNDV